MIIDLNRDNYEAETLQSKLPAMVDFWGPQCRPCLALTSVVHKLEKEYISKIKVAKVNATENRMLCARLRVLGLPTFIFYKDGAEIKRLTGEKITEKDLITSIKALIS